MSPDFVPLAGPHGPAPDLPGGVDAGADIPGRVRRPRKVLPEALSLARVRGHVHLTEKSRGSLYHFSIVSRGMVAFVRSRFAARILATPAEVAAEFRSDCARLRAIVEAPVISRELWLRSRHGTFRFFRIAADGIAEIGRDGPGGTDTGTPALPSGTKS